MTGDHAGRTVDLTALGAAMATLSPDHQVVVALRYYRDLTIDDIAGRLGIPAGTVQSRLHYALKRLHEALDAGDSQGSSDERPRLEAGLRALYRAEVSEIERRRSRCGVTWRRSFRPWHFVAVGSAGAAASRSLRPPPCCSSVGRWRRGPASCGCRRSCLPCRPRRSQWSPPHRRRDCISSHDRAPRAISSPTPTPSASEAPSPTPASLNLTWTKVALDEKSPRLAWVGDRFVLVDKESGRVRTSTDGASWQSLQPGDPDPGYVDLLKGSFASWQDDAVGWWNPQDHEGGDIAGAPPITARDVLQVVHPPAAPTSTTPFKGRIESIGIGPGASSPRSTPTSTGTDGSPRSLVSGRITIGPVA